MVVLYDPAEKEEKMEKLREKYRNGNIWDKALAILQTPGVALGDRLKAASAIIELELSEYGVDPQMGSMAFDMLANYVLGSVIEGGVKGIRKVKAAKNAANAVKAAEGVIGSADEAVETAASSQKAVGALTEGAGNLIDGIKITDGKVGGKIPVDEFKTIRQSSIKNPDADSITLGKFTNDADSYIARAGKDSSYFDMGKDYGRIQKQYNLSDKEMFDYFNRLALDDSIAKNKTIRFSHNPLDYESGAIVSEWEYIKAKLGVTNANLVFRGGFWYVQ